MTEKCKSCYGSLLNANHKTKHRRYLKFHLRAVKKLHAEHLSKGQCRVCQTPLNLYSKLCDFHGTVQRRYNRKYQKCSPWKRGGVGRPPFVPQEAALK